MKTIYFFSGSWCSPCKQLKPVVDRLAEKYRANVMYIDIEEAPDLASDFNICSVPTMVQIVNDREIGRIVGTPNMTELDRFVRAVS